MTLHFKKKIGHELSRKSLLSFKNILNALLNPKLAAPQSPLVCAALNALGPPRQAHGCLQTTTGENELLSMH